VAGVVDAVGAGVPDLRAGARVGLGWGGHCGHCASCRRGDFVTCRVAARIPGISFDGGHADYAIAPAVALARIPEGLSATDAAPLMCAGITTFNSLRNAGARSGDLISGRRGIQGWPSGTSADSEDTLAFSARNGVRPMTELFPLERAAEAYRSHDERQGALPGGGDDGKLIRSRSSKASGCHRGRSRSGLAWAARADPRKGIALQRTLRGEAIRLRASERHLPDLQAFARLRQFLASSA
jgi:hypothetical protein